MYHGKWQIEKRRLSTSVSLAEEFGTTAFCSPLPIRVNFSCPYPGAVMEPTQLQLILNVVTITGMTSLVGYCYLLRKENRKLASQLPAVPSAAPRTAELDIRSFASASRTRWVKSISSSKSGHDCR